MIGVELPNTLDLKIVETDPDVATGRAQGGTKPAVLETGATVMVPQFLEVRGERQAGRGGGGSAVQGGEKDRGVGWTARVVRVCCCHRGRLPRKRSVVSLRPSRDTCHL